jgi:hypothetical protein
MQHQNLETTTGYSFILVLKAHHVFYKFTSNIAIASKLEDTKATSAHKALHCSRYSLSTSRYTLQQQAQLISVNLPIRFRGVPLSYALPIPA